MKRSDMVNKIEEFFHREVFTGADLLSYLEDLGMQPPNITLDELIPGLNVKHVSEETHYYSCWEPEHETK